MCGAGFAAGYFAGLSWGMRIKDSSDKELWRLGGWESRLKVA